MLQLFRPKNLVFLAFCQWLIYYAVITPILVKYGLSPLMSSSLIWLIILSTLLICAGGYIINDYFDIKIDRINKPLKVIIGDKISKTLAMRLYLAVTSIGITLGLAVAFLIKSFSFGFVFLVVPGMLWFYSSSYKRQFLIGNLIVALLCALSIMLPLIVESHLLTQQYGDLLMQTPIYKTLYTWVCGYAAFAFFLTLIREVVKDIEDVAGDRELECHTLPVVWGVSKAKVFVSVLLILSCVAMFVVDWLYLDLPKTTFFTIFSPTNIFILFSMIIAFLLSKTEVDYHKISSLLKLFMLVGMLYSLVFYYNIAQTYNLSIFGLFKVA